MPLIRLNVAGNHLALHRSTGRWQPCLDRALKGSGPVIIMTHGFKYAPAEGRACPHVSIFSTSPAGALTKSTRWPEPLGFDGGSASEGLAIAFGWNARGPVWTAHKSALVAGRKLAEVVARIHRTAPHRRVHLMAHSMGSEVMLEALHHLPAGSVNRVLLLTGASYHSRAVAALRTPAGRSVELFNMISRENDVIDFIFERTIVPPMKGDRSIGFGIQMANAVNIQLDCKFTLGRLNAFGSEIAPPTRRICHWSSYSRDGILPFYRRLLREPETLALHDLKSILPEQPSPRWSRLRPQWHWPFTLNGSKSNVAEHAANLRLQR